ncbi:uncharacterized protein LOC119337741 isoform X1 [Triticum dicoccoides]|uniref:uncharacterized protein LOC119337741 isoform X1 n=1 Tax=Triticum dicoccoides TaxID=85692 RepID=UPI001891D2AE|nr:uncharacterized protein LOC119337741 isoform X1 [Triticum dicoccoides]
MWCGRRFKITSESYFNCNAMGKEARSTRNTHYVNRMSVLSWCGVRAGLVHEVGASCTRLFFPGGCRRRSSPTLNSVKRFNGVGGRAAAANQPDDDGVRKAMVIMLMA